MLLGRTKNYALKILCTVFTVCVLFDSTVFATNLCPFSSLAERYTELPSHYQNIRPLPATPLSEFFIVTKPEEMPLPGTEVFVKTLSGGAIIEIGASAPTGLKNEVRLTNLAHAVYPETFLPAHFEPSVRPIGAVVTPYQRESQNLDFLVNKKVSVSQRSSIVIQMAQAAAKLEDLKLSHGDIKLGNFLLLKDGSLRVIDFGASQPYGAKDFVRVVRGTRLVRGPQTLEELPSYRGDLHALRMNLWMALTGEAFEEPFRKADSRFYFANHKNGVLIMPKHGPDFSPSADPFLAIAAWTPVSQITSLKEYSELIQTAGMYSERGDLNGFLKFYTEGYLEKMPPELAARTIVESEKLTTAFSQNGLPLSKDQTTAIVRALRSYQTVQPGSRYEVTPYYDKGRVQKALRGKAFRVRFWFSPLRIFSRS